MNDEVSNQAEEAERESSDFKADSVQEHAPTSTGSAGRPRGRRLRMGVLAANVALTLGCAFLLAYIDGPYWDSSIMPMDSQIMIDGVTTGLQVMHFAPLTFVTVLAAWGPWQAWVRALALLGWIVGDMFAHQAFSWWLGYRHEAYATFWYATLELILAAVLLCMPAALSLAFVGAWLRLRIGPAGLRPIQISILSMMVATFVLGAAFAGQVAVEQTPEWGPVYDLAEGESIEIMVDRKEILAQMVYGGTLLALLFGLIVAAAYRWWARAVLLLLISGYGGISYYFASQAAPQFPFSQPNILLVIYSGSIIGLIAACFWVAIHVRCLDRSGWPCSRRRRFVAVQR
jgi:hypothetical protein